SSPPQEQPPITSESSMTLLNTLMESCTTLSHKVDQLEQDKIAQALEIFKLKMRVKKLEKQRRSKSSRLKRLRKVGERIKAVDADEDVTLVDAETQVDLVTMTMAQTLIKMKAKKARLLDEPMAKRLHDEEVEQVVAREKKEKDDLEKDKVLQLQYVDKQENIDRNVVVEQMKNMTVYLKNMTGYKMENFRGMTYDKVRPIFKREYNKVQTLFKPDKYEEPTKKRVAEETLLQESFKKLKAVEVSSSKSTQDTPTIDPKEMSKEDVQNMLEIVLVSEFMVKALQVKYPLIDWEIHSEGSRSHWKIIRVVKEKFSTSVPTVDKEKALWVELKRLFEQYTEDVPWKLQRYIEELSHIEWSYDLTLSAKLQVKEDGDMARDLVIKIFMEANKPKSRNLDTSSK
nr:hypothetical protein [Tanacetum cinerariifolium]